MTDQIEPSYRWATITLSDSVNLSPRPRGITALTDGNLAIVGSDDVVVTVPVAAGGVYPYAVKRINSTNSTATAMGLY